ncbi:LytTR family DNA-binding domain-containing protein [Erythrobacter sp. JK5]|uniref:LytTR family DNA-binding domain-containing protein n=1 Tax=Erythrobacter sp. JK5 TaxID=2829500 RepID=UPI001BA8EDEF|nr:LytTR family DNA-binding domain-containing protein [Erythrobacter sp. JK5]QUL37736.1 LytTR family transcriptional regulator DNA-binding domain-containing protein [Erythrobacter sp. JK5]
MSELPSESTTLRLRQLVVDLAIMAIIGFGLALLGPFGSYMQPLEIRFLYWVVLSFAGYLCYVPVAGLVLSFGRRLALPDWTLWVAAVLIGTVPMTAIVILVNQLPGPFVVPRYGAISQTYAHVLVIGAVVVIIFQLLEKRSPPKATTLGFVAASPVAAGPEPVRTPLLDRLPADLGTDVIALEMEDHYVRVHTALGSELVLLRLRDAIAELDGIEGRQVHRSWWVARGAVEEVVREGRNVRLKLPRGIEAPVARAQVGDLRDSGWI